jgi:hypothetical protein
MKTIKSVALTLALLVVSGSAYGKKNQDAPPAFGTAKSVYVQAESGDYTKPGITSADRQAIQNVQDALKSWNRYTLAAHAEQADLVFVVRKGTPVGGAEDDGGLRGGTQAASGRGGSSTSASADRMGTSMQASVDEDRLRVYAVGANGKLDGPIWTREITNGLDQPGVAIIQQLRMTVERTFPATPATAVKPAS